MKVWELIAALSEMQANAEIFVYSPGLRHSFETTRLVLIDETDSSSGAYIHTRKEES